MGGNTEDGVLLEVLELDPLNRHNNRVQRVAVVPATILRKGVLNTPYYVVVSSVPFHGGRCFTPLAYEDSTMVQKV